MRLSTRAQIDIGFAVALLLLILVSVISFRGLERLSTDDAAVVENQRVLLRLEGIVSTLKDAETGQRGYLLTRQERFLEPYDVAHGLIDRELAALERVTAGDTMAQRYLGTLRRLTARKLEIIRTTVALGQRGEFDRAISIVGEGVGKEIMDQIRRVAAEMIRVQERALERRRGAAIRSERFALWMIGLGPILALVVVGIARYGILRELNARDEAQTALGRTARSLRQLNEIIAAPGAERFDDILKLGCEHFGLASGLLSRVRGDRWEVVAAYPPGGELAPGASFPLADVYCSVTFTAPEPLAIQRAGTSEWAGSRCYTAFGVESYLGAPVRVAGRLDGTLCFMDTTPRNRPFTEAERDFLRILSQWVGAELARREANATLRAREERYRGLVESASDLIYTTDREGRLTYVNPPFVGTTGYSEEELLGRYAISLVRPDHRRGVAEFYRAQIEAGRPASYHRLPVVTREGREVWLGQNNVLLTEEGEVVGVQAVARDITRQYETERMKDEFLSVVSHELRTPLTAIRGSLGLLASGKMGTLQERGQRMLEIAARNTDRLVRLINDLLDLEKMASGKETIERRPVTAAELVTQASDVMRPMATEAGVTLEAEGVEDVLWADPDRILQVLTNLLSNAIKYSPQGGVVRLWTERVGEEVIFRVRDQGRGIPADKLESVFERFQQVDSSDARDKGGTGLGLPIARRIAEQHGGRLWVESEWGKGSTFSLGLPLPHELPAPPEDTHPRVLVCDDDGAIAVMAREVLEQEGYRVTITRSGEEALHAARSNPPAAILLDMRMPGMGGAETLAALRRHEETRGIPVIIFSVLSESEAGAGIADVAGWLTKPAEVTSIVDAVGRALAGETPHCDVLIVEDDDGIAGVLRELFRGHGVSSVHVRTGAEAVEVSQRTDFSLLVLDLGLPDTDGFAVIDWLRRHNVLGQIPVLVYTARDLNDRERERLGPAEIMTKSRVSLEAFEQRAAELLGRVVGGTKEK